jgi:hypothetical protein
MPEKPGAPGLKSLIPILLPGLTPLMVSFWPRIISAKNEHPFTAPCSTSPYVTSIGKMFGNDDIVNFRVVFAESLG